MPALNDNAIPFQFMIGGETVCEGKLHLRRLLSSTAQAPAATNYKSFPISPAQAQQLLRKVDAKTVDFLRVLAEKQGEVSFGEMKKIFGIKEWSDFSTRYGKGLTRALRHLTDNSSATLLWWVDDEWKSNDDAEGPIYVDGTALKSLRLAFGLEAA
ncbi:MAG: hypothetical protein AVDCRST_MAG31-2588 [uncultured Sphingomonas sp.]|uniref:Uncharacterized protein n=1 Tax=uncultured Sphingomonas sp. TaxID=158754 RepID=A0A6J4TVI4_9SPHN|nr:hypothetical protein [uncultured Sphingomonas sp.]CAA9533259.1 MAG: hypothetical protein AVDCRST_MAG31-2588 [uncultured Sphingomonas sp.]